MKTDQPTCRVIVRRAINPDATGVDSFRVVERDGVVVGRTHQRTHVDSCIRTDWYFRAAEGSGLKSRSFDTLEAMRIELGDTRNDTADLVERAG